MSSKPLVLVLGISGRTGVSVTTGLLASNAFRIAALVRPSSVSKPAVQAFSEKGVDIREGDLRDDLEKLKGYLRGVDILISVVDANAILAQKPIFQAAKEVGVKRVVPCDFGTPGAKGVRTLQDEKLEVREYIQDIGLPYTVIDVGWWMQLALPHPTKSTSMFKPFSHEICGNGDKKFLVTDLAHIGLFVARIVADERTINKSVIVWEDELTQEQTESIGEKHSGEEEVLKAARIHVPGDELLKRAVVAKDLFEKEPSILNHMILTATHYQISVYILGENSLENAKKLGYLDARELYPDVATTSFEDFAGSWYAAEAWGAI